MTDSQVLMEHPDLPHTKHHPPKVPRRTFETHWSGKGWVEHATSDANPPEPPEPSNPSKKPSTRRRVNS